MLYSMSIMMLLVVSVSMVAVMSKEITDSAS
jgi:hypothetical protein